MGAKAITLLLVCLALAGCMHVDAARELKQSAVGTADDMKCWANTLCGLGNSCQTVYTAKSPPSPTDLMTYAHVLVDLCVSLGDVANIVVILTAVLNISLDACIIVLVGIKAADVVLFISAVVALIVKIQANISLCVQLLVALILNIKIDVDVCIQLLVALYVKLGVALFVNIVAQVFVGLIAELDLVVNLLVGLFLDVSVGVVVVAQIFIALGKATCQTVCEHMINAGNADWSTNCQTILTTCKTLPGGLDFVISLCNSSTIILNFCVSARIICVGLLGILGICLG